MTKFKNTNCDKTQFVTKLKKIVTKLKNLNCDKTKKTQNVTKLKNLNCDQTQKLEL